MSDSITNAIVGGLIILMVGWLKLDINRLADRLDRFEERVTAQLAELSSRVARIEGRLDEREHTN